MKVPIKGDIKYLIDCYDAAIKVSDDKIVDYVFLENLQCGICRKLLYSKNYPRIWNKGIKFIKKNKSLFDDELFDCEDCYWFIIPIHYPIPYMVRKSLEARKTVLQEILKTL